MSNVYASEPATTGKVIFETTHGPLEIQLWCRECPRTTKFFLQLCQDGFYDGMIFHRIVPDFLIQTGSIRTGKDAFKVSEEAMSEYKKKVNADEALERRRYELHSRLRFNHRGQVAMALELDQEDESGSIQPQFFITLDEAPYLDAKHVLFGTISGPTIFNAIRIGKVEVDESTSQPVDLEDAPRIKAVKIVDNNFHPDVVELSNVPWREKKTKKAKKKRKAVRNTNVLSFGDDVDEDASESGIKSSHDVLKNDRLSSSIDKEVAEKLQENEPAKKKTKRDERQSTEELTATNSTVEELEKSTSNVEFVSSTKNEAPVKMEKPNQKRPEKKEPKKSALEEMRAKYAQKSKSKKERETDTLKKLATFQSKVKEKVAATKVGDTLDHLSKDNSLAARMARRAAEKDGSSGARECAMETYRGQVLESDEEDGNKNWLSTKFKCRKHMDHQAGLAEDGRDLNDYKVEDDNGEDRDGKDRKKRKKHKSHRK